MTTDKSAEAANLANLNENIVKIEELSQRLVSALANKREYDQALAGPSQDVFIKAAGAYWAETLANPAKLIEQQATYWGKTLEHFVAAQQAMTSEIAAGDDGEKDRRFSNPLWNTNPYFNFVKQQYQLNSQAIESALDNLEDIEDGDRARITYFTKQIVDAFAPTNFLATNPDALEKAVETEGQSLIDGLENLVRDIEASDGELLVTLADKDAFTVGENIAVCEGDVVFRNRMMELIQYAPKTDQVHAIPIVIFPPWINKFYILDLKPKNSLISWLTEQGFTVFVTSWKNPTADYADVSVDTYIEEGYLTAIDQIKSITGQKKVNAVGYCIGGTTLAMTLAYMKKKKDKSVASATFFTTVTDFSDQREFTPFLQDDFVDGIEREATEKGFLDSFFMSRTFSYLRSNDLIYQPAIRSYMLGETPPAFDLLYWNGDSTNLPGRMVVQYLRELCQKNLFAGRGIEILGETLKLSDVDVSLCAIACETDHIANWQDSLRGVAAMGSKEKTFILSQSGHIAGIINPPSKKKYGHYTNTSADMDAEEWRDTADFNEGSWWPRWGKWLSSKSGKMIDARRAENPMYPAPGKYVLET